MKFKINTVNCEGWSKIWLFLFMRKRKECKAINEIIPWGIQEGEVSEVWCKEKTFLVFFVVPHLYVLTSFFVRHSHYCESWALAFSGGHFFVFCRHCYCCPKMERWKTMEEKAKEISHLLSQKERGIQHWIPFFEGPKWEIERERGFVFVSSLFIFLIIAILEGLWKSTEKTPSIYSNEIPWRCAFNSRVHYKYNIQSNIM